MFNAKPARQFSVRPTTVLAVAGFYRCGGTDPGIGNRRDHRNIYLDRCGDAPLVAGFRSRQALPSRRRRRMLRRRGSSGPLGNVFLSLVPAAEGRNSGVRGSDRFPGGALATERAASGRRIGCQTSARGVRHRQLFLNPWSASLLPLQSRCSATVYGKPHMHPTLQ